MILTLDENELRNAVAEYIKNTLGKSVDPQTLEFTAGRGTNGITTTIDFNKSSSSKMQSNTNGSNNNSQSNLTPKSVVSEPKGTTETSVFNETEETEEADERGDNLSTVEDTGTEGEPVIPTSEDPFA